MVILTLLKEDYDNTIHPFIWEETLEQLANEFFDLPDSRADYPDAVTIKVSSAKME